MRLVIHHSLLNYFTSLSMERRDLVPDTILVPGFKAHVGAKRAEQQDDQMSW